jgi:hypothetical protein
MRKLVEKKLQENLLHGVGHAGVRREVLSSFTPYFAVIDADTKHHEPAA